MANPTITNEIRKEILVKDPVFTDDTFVAAGAIEIAKGTLLGRVTASKKLAQYDSGAADGTEVPIGVITYDLSIAGAGDTAIRALRGGVVAENTLLEHGVGAVTDKAVLDQLIDKSGIVPVAATDLGVLDNQ